MKKNVRLVLLFALIAVMLVMTAVFASAATIDVAAGGDLATAISGATAGDTININGDVTVSATITIDKDITIVGNGGTISSSVKTFTVTAGTVTFQDLKVTTTKVEAFEFAGSATVEFTGADTTINSSSERCWADSLATHTGTVTIRDGKYTAGGYGWLTSDSGSSTLNIYGGTFSSSGIRVISANNKITVNIYGGTFSNTGTGDVLYIGDGSAKLNVYGGTFKIENAASAGNCLEKQNGAVTIATGKDESNNDTVPAFRTNGTGAVVYTVATKTSGALTITGGTFAQSGSGNAFFLAAACTTSISNATISAVKDAVVWYENVTATIDNSCTITSDSGEQQTVAKLFKVGDKLYTLPDALAAVGKNGTITYVGTVAPGWVLDLNVDKAFTFDGSGSNLSYGLKVSKGTVTFNNLTITSSSGTCLTVASGASVTLKKTCKLTTDSGSFISCTGSVLIEGGTYKGSVVFGVGTSSAKISFTVNGGTFTNFALNSNNAYTTVTINNGNFTAAETGSYMLRQASSSYNYIYVNGGVFTSTGKANIITKDNGASGIAFVVQQKDPKVPLQFKHSGSGTFITTTASKTTGALVVIGVDMEHTGTGNALSLNATYPVELSDCKISAKGDKDAIVIAAAASPYVYLLGSTVTAENGKPINDTAAGKALIADTNAKLFTVGETAYSWKDALANVQNGGTITMTGAPNWVLFVDVDKSFTLVGNETELPGIYVKQGNVTLSDVNVKVNYTKATINMPGEAVTIDNDASVTINGGNYVGELQMMGGSMSGNEARLTINSGSFAPLSGGYLIHANYAYSIITINGGTFDAGASTTYLMRINDGTHNYIYIYGGTFNASGTGAMIQKGACTRFVVEKQADKEAPSFTHSGTGAILDTTNTSGVILVNGATFTHTGTADTSVAFKLSHNCGTVIRNATINTEKNSIVIAAGVYAYVDGCTVDNAKIANSGVLNDNADKFFKVGDQAYNWVDALTNVANGGTITVISNPAAKLIVDVDKTFTLVTASEDVILPQIYVWKGNVTFSNAKINSTGATVFVAEGAAVTLNSCTVTGSVAVSVSGALSINGGTFTATSGTVVATYAGCTSLIIENATLWGNGSGGCVYIYSTDCKSVTIRNSNLYGYRGIRFGAAVEDGTFTIEGGKWRPQYTGKYDAEAEKYGISDFCRDAQLICATDVATSNNTFSITGCDINNTVYGTGEKLSDVGATPTAHMVLDVNNAKNKWNFTDCEIVWGGSGSVVLLHVDNTINCPVTLTDCDLTYSGTAIMFNVTDNGSVTITRGTYTNNGSAAMVYISDGGMTVTVDGATFINKADSKMFVLNNGKLNIDNATLTQNGTATMIELGATQSGPLTITDSTLDSGSNLSINVQGKHPVSLTNVEVDSITIAENYPAAVNLVDVTFDEGELVDPSGVAAISTVKNFKINGTAYTWEEVMDAVKAGDTIVLVGDWGTVLEITAPVAFTLDANGNNVGGFTVAAGCNVTIVNCNVSVGIGVALTVSEGATVTLGEGNSFTNTGSSYLMNSYGTLTITGGTYAGAIHNGKGAVTIENGTFTHSGTFKHANGGYPIIWMNDKEATTIINDGTFTKTAAEHAMDCIIGTNDGDAKIVINGGTFEILGETHGHVANLHSSDVVEINGGTFISHNANYPVIRINGVAGTRYAANGSEAGTPYASMLQNFTTKGGSCGVQILTGNANAWAFTVKNATIENAAQSLFVVNRPSGTVTFEGGRYTLTGNTADASALNVIKGNVILDGVMFINNNATSTATITAAEGANVTLTNVIVLANNGSAYVSATETVAFGSASVKYDGDSYKLWMTNAGEADAAIDGAGVRVTTGTEGIRFTGSATKVEGATYGIIIAPAEYVAAAGAFTIEALEAWADGKNFTGAVYEKVLADKSFQDNGDTVSFSVALIGISNYTRSFAAIAYVETSEGIEYSSYDSADNARSMAQVAEAALEDVKDAADVDAGYIHETAEGKYSKYTTDERGVLAGYIA